MNSRFQIQLNGYCLILLYAIVLLIFKIYEKQKRQGPLNQLLPLSMKNASLYMLNYKSMNIYRPSALYNNVSMCTEFELTTYVVKQYKRLIPYQHVNSTTIMYDRLIDFLKVRSIKKGVFYRKVAGGIGNQLLSFFSALVLAEILHVPFLYDDEWLNQIATIIRPSGLSVIYVKSSLMKVAQKASTTNLICWTYDESFTQDKMKLNQFYRFAKRIRDLPLDSYVNRNELIQFQGNCPIFKYWIDNETKCQLLKEMGYINKTLSCSISNNQCYIDFIQNVLRKHVRFSDQVIDKINTVLEPYQNILRVIQHNTSFPRITNVVSIHARFGNLKGFSDFTDYFTFLSRNSTNSFINCIHSNKLNDKYIYVTSDSSKAKDIFREAFGDKYIESHLQVMHSGSEYHSLFNKSVFKNDRLQATLNAYVDLIIASMCSSFIGTQYSSFSSMIAMFSGSTVFYVSKDLDTCRYLDLYLPSYKYLNVCFTFK